jgi:inosine-uridine nucleoside N-ribohydrolase
VTSCSYAWPTPRAAREAAEQALIRVVHHCGARPEFVVLGDQRARVAPWRQGTPPLHATRQTVVMPTKVILDVDTGTDDAVALMTAALSLDIELVGATSVNGNTGVKYTTENTLRVFDWIGMPEIPVFRGMDRPIVRTQTELGVAAIIHKNLLDLPPCSRGATLRPEHAVDWLIDTYLASDGDIVLCPVWPLTNIAMAMQKEPRILDTIPEIVIMGGAHHMGNLTHSAEFNMMIDPEAARVVVNCGRPIRMAVCRPHRWAVPAPLVPLLLG